ncbi:hypothetical protein Y032_0039g73 [Ancylostoma ceylanicum]|uniref:Uncharacterized protein n=1 Tax=Ancylostoma ceylanicum TaxID=53326 RepID=A0A016UHR1_9BILA|nr:hypothetical protein Y032_0039g73 [Ancylostoma ceylanicum]
MYLRPPSLLMVPGWGTFTYGEEDKVGPGRSPGPKKGMKLCIIVRAKDVFIKCAVMAQILHTIQSQKSRSSNMAG